MPRVNVYITKDNYDKWQQLSNKSGFVNNVLRYDVGAAVAATHGVIQTASIAPRIDSNVTIKKPVPKGKFCEHGMSKGFCKQGCVFA